MKQADQEFLEELRRDFVPEAEEYLQTIVSGLLDLEKTPEESSGVLEEVFRAAHSLKGAAQAVQLRGVSSVCQVMESVFSGMKKGMLHPSADDFDTLQRAADALSGMTAFPGRQDGQNVDVLVQDLEKILTPKRNAAPPLRTPVLRKKTEEAPPIDEEPARGKEKPAPPTFCPEEEPFSGGQQPVAFKRKDEPPRSISQDSVRIGAAKLDALLFKAEELISVNLALAVRMEEIRDLLALVSEWRTEWERAFANLQRGGFGMETLPPPLREFFQHERASLRSLNEKIRDMGKALRADQRNAGGLIHDLLEGTRNILMLPFSSLLQSFPKIVRDLSRELGKEAETVVRGGDIEVDKRILEGLKDPLVHLVRNCLDHGLENKGDRLSAGKPACGTITIAVSQVEGSRVELLVADDGRGLDPDKLRESAIKAGILSRDDAAALDDASALMLIFRSGVSTSPIITDISGRGLGMAIVQEGVETLGGTLSLNSTQGKETVFRLSLPLTLATFRGVLVEEWGHLFVIPSASVERVARIEKKRIKHVEQRDTISFSGVPLALARLGQVLELPSPAERSSPRDTQTVVVLGSGNVSAAFGVDRVLNEQEVLLKPLGKQLQRIRNIAGATVLGSGKVVPVLNAADLIRSVKRGGSGHAFSPAGTEADVRKKVLVVEDSITSRTLIRNILAAGGYDVRTAVDGQEAWEALSMSTFDIVVSDVEMPRMNGFDLTARIRSESSTADIPVILVTSLESREDRERGVEAGADAYIVKSGFDQGSLLEVMRRLL